MKRVKIMLSAITVLAAVGGALAFKAKTFSALYCVTTLSPTTQGGVCKTPVIGKTTSDVEATSFFYTTTTSLAGCVNNTKACRPDKIRITAEP